MPFVAASKTKQLYELLKLDGLESAFKAGALFEWDQVPEAKTLFSEGESFVFLKAHAAVHDFLSCMSPGQLESVAGEVARLFPNSRMCRVELTPAGMIQIAYDTNQLPKVERLAVEVLALTDSFLSGIPPRELFEKVMTSIENEDVRCEFAFYPQKRGPSKDILDYIENNSEKLNRYLDQKGMPVEIRYDGSQLKVSVQLFDVAGRSLDHGFSSVMDFHDKMVSSTELLDTSSLKLLLGTHAGSPQLLNIQGVRETIESNSFFQTKSQALVQQLVQKWLDARRPRFQVLLNRAQGRRCH